MEGKSKSGENKLKEDEEIENEGEERKVKQEK